MLRVSIVIPVMNEEQNIAPMVEALQKSMVDIEYEVIFVDDGSTDSTVVEICKYTDTTIRLIQFSRNYGQTSAMAAGINSARGEYIVTIDGDLQNDPLDIPKLLQKLEKNNLDLVVGIRSKRQDGAIFRKLPSKIANFIIRKLTGVKITDTGCTLKIFRSSLAKRLELYGEMHRFIPILASFHGAKIAEIPVRHHSRKFGVSKYGIERTLKVLSDLLLLFFFQRYKQKPMHLFGVLGIGSFSIGSLILFYMAILKISGESIGHRPLFFMGILCIIAAFQFITTGFIAELLTRTYYNSPIKKPYEIYAEYQGGEIIKLDKEKT